MYINTMLPYSNYCTMLMLSVYMYGYFTRHIYIAAAIPYSMRHGVTGWYQSLGSATFKTSTSHGYTFQLQVHSYQSVPIFLDIPFLDSWILSIFQFSITYLGYREIGDKRWELEMILVCPERILVPFHMILVERNTTQLWFYKE